MGAVPNETRIVASVPCEATATTTSKDNEGHKDRHVLLSPHLLELFRAGAKQRWTSSYRHFPRSDRASCESSNPWPTPFDGAMLPSADIVGHPSNNGSSKGNSSSQRTDMLTAATCTNRPGRKCGLTTTSSASAINARSNTGVSPPIIARSGWTTLATPSDIRATRCDRSCTCSPIARGTLDDCFNTRRPARACDGSGSSTNSTPNSSAILRSCLAETMSHFSLASAITAT